MIHSAEKHGEPGQGQERARLLVCRILFGFVVLFVWEFVTGRWVDAFWFSSPLRIFRMIEEWVQEGKIFGHLAVTLRETFLGYLLGSTLGVAVGLLFSRLKFMAKVMDPYIVAVNGIPRIALAPLFIIWFGIGELSKVILASTVTFFLCFYGTLSGVRAVEPAYLNIARLMGANGSQTFVKVVLPAAAPWIVAAMKVSVPFSLVGAIVGEFMASTKGLGHLIQLSSAQFDTTGAVTGVLLLMVIVMVFNAALDRLERYVLRWRPKDLSGAAREVH